MSSSSPRRVITGVAAIVAIFAVLASVGTLLILLGGRLRAGAEIHPLL